MVTETTDFFSTGQCTGMGGNSDWAEQKATGSYWYRATLGPVTGGVQEWSTDSTDGVDGTWVVVT
jgi:hypothetical protein